MGQEEYPFVRNGEIPIKLFIIGRCSLDIKRGYQSTGLTIMVVMRRSTAVGVLKKNKLKTDGQTFLLLTRAIQKQYRNGNQFLGLVAT